MSSNEHQKRTAVGTADWLAPHRDVFLDGLGEHGYAPSTIRHYRRVTGFFCAQVELRGLGAEALEESVLADLRTAVPGEMTSRAQSGWTSCVEVAQAAREDLGAAMRAILDVLARESSRTIGDRTVAETWSGILDSSGPHSALNRVLSEWAAADPKPLVLFIDEIDSLVGGTLISVLRQLRSGYRDRPRHFPQSVVLCGVRDVRDYRIRSSSLKFPVNSRCKSLTYHG